MLFRSGIYYVAKLALAFGLEAPIQLKLPKYGCFIFRANLRSVAFESALQIETKLQKLCNSTVERKPETGKKQSPRRVHKRYPKVLPDNLFTPR